MRGVFDDQELEAVRPPRDTELTLGSGALLSILGGLVLLCGLCFGWGYSVGHRSPRPTSSANAPRPATEQEPLQASGNIPKPSAVAQTPVPQQPASDAEDQSTASSDSAAISANGTAVVAPATGMTAQPEVRPALPAIGSVQGMPNGVAPVVHPTPLQTQAGQQPGPQFMVQIAAVSNAGDAEVLTNALRKRNYPVVSKREPADNFIHVRIGPFASRQIADQWKMKLLNDGYNAQVQP
jgi:DedD protein